MPRYPIDRATNFIVEDESWTVVEYDHTSVPGVIYLSLTEGKINLEYDNLEEPYADEDKLAAYHLLVPEQPQMFMVNPNEPINPVYTLVKNGFICNEECELISQDRSIIDKDLYAVGVGTATILVQLKKYPSVQKELIVQVSQSEPVASFYLDGNEKLRLDRVGIYVLKSTDDVLPEGVVFSINNINEKGEILAKIIPNDKKYAGQTNLCTIKANDKNVLGEITLFASYNGVNYEKTITIIPLW